MKEATGELSTTVIAIVAIAAILAIFTAFLLPTLRSQIALSQACSNGPGYNVTNRDGSKITCTTATGTGVNRKWNCTYTPNGSSASAGGTKTCTNAEA